MKKLSDSDLKKILQEKLARFESEVSADSEQQVFHHLKQSSKTQSAILRNAIYLLFGILIIAPLTYFSIRKQNKNLDNQLLKSEDAVKAETVATIEKPIAAVEELQSKKENSVLKISKTKTHKYFKSDVIATKDNYKYEQQSEKPEVDALVSLNVKQSDELTKSENNVKSDQKLETKKDISLDSTLNPAASQTVSAKKIMLTFSVQPFLNYKDLRPISDGIYVGNFSLPSPFSAQRLGVNLKTAMEYEVTTNKFISLGISYFSYCNSLTYQAENTEGINTLNSFTDKVSGVALSLGALYPLKLKTNRKQFVSVGLDVQKIKGTALSQKAQLMVSLGYSNRWSLGKKEFRLTPVFNYSLTKLHYPGVMVQPYWAGIELGYSIPVK
jgi:hypothetical protein